MSTNNHPGHPAPCVPSEADVLLVSKLFNGILFFDPSEERIMRSAQLIANHVAAEKMKAIEFYSATCIQKHEYEKVIANLRRDLARAREELRYKADDFQTCQNVLARTEVRELKAEAEIKRLQGIASDLQNIAIEKGEAIVSLHQQLTQSLATGERLRVALESIGGMTMSRVANSSNGFSRCVEIASEALAASPHAAPAGSILDSGRDVTDEMAPEIERVVREAHEKLERNPAAPAAVHEDTKRLDWLLELIRREGTCGLLNIKWTNPNESDPMEEDDVILDREAIDTAMSAAPLPPTKAGENA